jgi:hypothetical protein
MLMELVPFIYDCVYEDSEVEFLIEEKEDYPSYCDEDNDHQEEEEVIDERFEYSMMNQKQLMITFLNVRLLKMLSSMITYFLKIHMLEVIWMVISKMISLKAF